MILRRLAGTVLLIAWMPCGMAGPLEDYMARPDPEYGLRIVRADRVAEGTIAVLELTPQAWRTERDVAPALWRHWLEVYVPAAVEHDTALLEIAGGENGAAPPGSPDGYLAGMAVKLRAVTARLHNVPNQPLVFTADPESRKRREDQILSFAWNRQLVTGDPGWLVQMAMARSAIRAMDAVTGYCATGMPAVAKVRRFVLTGASKRGWTAWLAAAADRRVVGVAPRVIDLLNLEPSFRHHHAAYGRYADAVRDYVNQGILQKMGTPEMRATLPHTPSEAGGGRGNRTLDLRLMSPLLYQLSYPAKPARRVCIRPGETGVNRGLTPRVDFASFRTRLVPWHRCPTKSSCTTTVARCAGSTPGHLSGAASWIHPDGWPFRRRRKPSDVSLTSTAPAARSRSAISYRGRSAMASMRCFSFSANGFRRLVGSLAFRG